MSPGQRKLSPLAGKVSKQQSRSCELTKETDLQYAGLPNVLTGKAGAAYPGWASRGKIRATETRFP